MPRRRRNRFVDLVGFPYHLSKGKEGRDNIIKECVRTGRRAFTDSLFSHEAPKQQYQKSLAHRRVPLRIGPANDQIPQSGPSLPPRRASHPYGNWRVSRRQPASARCRIHIHGKCKRTRRARGQFAALGAQRPAYPGFAFRRVSFLGPGGLLPTDARRRLCRRRGVSRAARTMGCSKCQIAWPNGAAEGRGTEGTGESRLTSANYNIETPGG